MTDRVGDLLVDIQTVQGGFFGNRGIRRYALGLARALRERGSVRALLLNPNRPWLEAFPTELVDGGAPSWATRRTLRQLDEDGAAAYVMTSAFEQATPADSALPSYVAESGMPLVMILYDLIPEIVDVYPPALMPAYRARRQLVREADLVLTLSAHVRRDAIRRLDIPDDRVAVIGAAASDFFRPRGPGERPHDLVAERVPRITRPFVLSVTGWLAHKNVDGLIRGWSRLPHAIRRRHQLVLTCPLPPGAESVWSEQAESLGLGPDDVVVTGRVDDDVLRALYQEAALFVLPSYEEGFGLPVLEAVRCGCPAITSCTSSLPEVLDWEPATFRPENVDGIAAVLERGLLDPVFRSDLRAVGDAAVRRHTWNHVAEQTMRACASMPGARRPRRVPPPRIAVVGAFTAPTSPTVVARDGLVPLLPPQSAVDWFDTTATSRPGSFRTPRVRSGGAGLYPVSALGRVRDAWAYDVIVYVAGGEPGQELVELAESHPGVVWFVERPRDDVVASRLARAASAIVRPSHLSALTVEPGPFGRAAPVLTAPDDGGSAARAVLDAAALQGVPVTQPAH